MADRSLRQRLDPQLPDRRRPSERRPSERRPSGLSAGAVDEPALLGQLRISRRHLLGWIAVVMVFAVAIGVSTLTPAGQRFWSSSTGQLSTGGVGLAFPDDRQPVSKTDAGLRVAFAIVNDDITSETLDYTVTLATVTGQHAVPGHAVVRPHSTEFVQVSVPGTNSETEWQQVQVKAPGNRLITYHNRGNSDDH